MSKNVKIEPQIHKNMGQFRFSSANPRFGTKKSKFLGKNKKYVSNNIDWDTQ
jgi:hypothetical protein